MDQVIHHAHADKEPVDASVQFEQQKEHLAVQDPDQPLIRPEMLQFLNPRLAIIVKVDGDSQSQEPEAHIADLALQMTDANAAVLDIARFEQDYQDLADAIEVENEQERNEQA